MSAYICDKNHIVYLVQAAMSRRLNGHGGPFRWYHNGEHHQLACNDYETAADVANMLLRENYASVSARYPGESSATLPGPNGGVAPINAADIGNWPEIDPVQVLKSCDCYAYQACEHDGWQASEAHTFINRLRAAAWHALPGYEEAEWGAPKTADHSRLQRIA